MQARLIRAVALVAPFAASIVFVALVSAVFPAPLESFWLYLAWWVVLTALATLVLVAVDRVARRLLPLAVLFKLSLVFPDRAPSRFRTALNSRSVDTLEERVAAMKAGQADATPVEAAQELLELVAALDTHDPLTRGHSDRVRAYSQMIAEEMKLSEEEIDLLNWAALLHDIGKLEVPTEILEKEGRPNDEEWAILRRHPEFGGEIVAPLRGWLGAWANAVSQHHERWDGGGYPAGATGEQIGLAARIVAVADVFDVITSARSYKSASDAQAAREEIAHCAGAQFDPRVVRAFLAISLGKLRFAMGPLSWLSHAPLLGRLPLTPAIGTVSGALADRGVGGSLQQLERLHSQLGLPRDHRGLGHPLHRGRARTAPPTAQWPQRPLDSAHSRISEQSSHHHQLASGRMGMLSGRLEPRDQAASPLADRGGFRAWARQRFVCSATDRRSWSVGLPGCLSRRACRVPRRTGRFHRRPGGRLWRRLSGSAP